MGDLDSKTWLTYNEAAKRIGRSRTSIRSWRRQGMPMRWRNTPDGPERIVDESVLLAWFREKLQADPVHQARMRKHAREAGLPVPEVPKVRRHQEDPSRRSESQSTLEDETPIDVLAHQRAEAFREVLNATALTEGGPEFYALQLALKTETPACDGITAFTDTSGTMEQDQREIMEAICWHCPVLEKCRAFAEVAKPEGFWAGRRWARGSYRPSTEAGPAAA